MLLNLAFFLDHQYTEWVPEINTLRQIPRKTNELAIPRPVSNKVMHFVMQEHAYALQNKPTVDVLPASDQPLDASTANVCNAYLRWLAEPQQADMDAELSDAVFWALIAGEGYVKWCFDAAKKRPDYQSICPLDVYVDPFANRFSRARWVIHEQYMDVKEVEAIYGQKVKVTDADSTKVALLKEMGQAPVLQGALVNEMWVKPGVGGHDKGLFVVWSGNTLLVPPRPYPYRHGQLPFTQIGSIPRPKTPHYTCSVKYLRSPQMELNKYHQQKLSSREAFANPKWWIDTALELEADPNDSPRQILRGNSQGGQLKPEILQGSLMQDSGDGDWIRNEMMDVVGLHEVSQAQVPGRVEAAKAIEMLKEADSSRLEELERTIQNSVSNGSWQCLMLTKQFVSEEQIVQTYSAEGYPEVHRFKSSNISEFMRIRCTMGTGLSRSRAARTDAAMVMWQNGVIKDPETFAQIVDVPIDTVSPQRAYDIKLARNENLQISSHDDGVAIRPNSWDEHAVHIREHNNYRKTAEYSEKSDNIKKKFEFHVTQHEAMEIEQLKKDALKAQLAQGIDPTAQKTQAPATGDPNADPNAEPPQ